MFEKLKKKKRVPKKKEQDNKNTLFIFNLKNKNII